MDKIIPLHNNILVKKIEIEETSGSIIVPDMGNENPNYGEVIAVGPGLKTAYGIWIDNTVKVGDKVILPAFGGQKLSFDNEDYIIIKDIDILAKI